MCFKSVFSYVCQILIFSLISSWLRLLQSRTILSKSEWLLICIFSGNWGLLKSNTFSWNISLSFFFKKISHTWFRWLTKWSLKCSLRLRSGNKWLNLSIRFPNYLLFHFWNILLSNICILCSFSRVSCWLHKTLGISFRWNLLLNCSCLWIWVCLFWLS